MEADSSDRKPGLSVADMLDNEEWIVAAGDAVIQKRCDSGIESLTPVERLTYCLWVADYSLRNAGDLETARDLAPEFQRDAATLAAHLGLRFTQESFALPRTSLESEYFTRFDDICREIRSAREPGA